MSSEPVFTVQIRRDPENPAHHCVVDVMPTMKPGSLVGFRCVDIKNARLEFKDDTPLEPANEKAFTIGDGVEKRIRHDVGIGSYPFEVTWGTSTHGGANLIVEIVDMPTSTGTR